LHLSEVMARALRDALKTKAIETTHTEALELIAKAFGYENWNILSAKIEEAESSASAKAPGSDDGSPSVAAMLALEANHRARNILSVVQAITHQTKASSVQEFVARFDERIRSLKASHDLLVNSKWRIPLAEVVRAQLAHFGPILDSRIIVRGPDLMMTPLAAQALGMAIHELATNAGKYGALSNDTGHVIAWGLERADAGGERFRMDWSESNGPTVVPPTRRGFGSTVIITTAEYSLGGEAAIYYALSGLMCS
jgi:two-component sensor histidine kinase